MSCGNLRIGRMPNITLTPAEPAPSRASVDNVTWECIVSHQLKTPLCAMTAELDRNRSFDADTMRRNIQRLLRLIDQLHLAGICRSQSRIDLVPISLVELARRVCIRLAPLALDQDRTLAFRVFKKQVNVLADQVLAEEVLFNVIENAIKYSPPRSEIVVAVTASSQVHVMDRGPGIDPADEDLIFEPFKRGHRTLNRPGSGLGLALAQSIVDLHKGEMRHRPRVDGGTAFSISFQKPNT